MTESHIDVFWHPDALKHNPSAGVFGGQPSPLLAVDEMHPENAERMRNMLAILQRGPLSTHLSWHDGRHASDLRGTDQATVILQIRLNNVYATISDHPAEAAQAVLLFASGNWNGQNVSNPLRIFKMIERNKMIKKKKILIKQ